MEAHSESFLENTKSDYLEFSYRIVKLELYKASWTLKNYWSVQEIWNYGVQVNRYMEAK